MSEFHERGAQAAQGALREPEAAEAAAGLRSPLLRLDQLPAFFAALAAAPTRVLMLDYDGTLAPFRIEPHRARPYPGVCELLAAIMATQTTRVVIISGRWVRDLIPLLGLERLPEIWGSHGRERLQPDGRYEFAEIPPPAMQALLRADAWEAPLRQAGGRVERKPASLALHWRGLPAARAERLRALLLAHWEALECRDGLDLRHFDSGIEIVVRGCSKATAVEALLAEAGPGAITAFLGDDLTDEDALRAIHGRGLGVLVAPGSRHTAAEAWLRPPQEVRAFLERWLIACGGSADLAASQP